MLVPVWAAHGLLVDAELARAEGIDTPAHWSSAAAAFAPLHRPYELARIRHRWAEALLVASGDRTAAATLLREAHRTAGQLGARPLTTAIELLAGRARIPLAAPDRGATPNSRPPSPSRTTTAPATTRRTRSASRTGCARRPPPRWSPSD